MNYQVENKDGLAFIECAQDGGCLLSEGDALDLIAACGENRTDRLLIHNENLPAEFFQLKTGLAGQILQKFVNYRVRAAAIIPDDRAYVGRFGEMVLEANRRNQFRVFANREMAISWLVSI
jgi:hypothetical protein